VFVIGAGGYIGEEIAVAFRKAGYVVYGLIRNPTKQNQLLKNEIIPVIGYSSFHSINKLISKH
jgi:nucleoside-diphosphate-sugar epimerase